MGGRLALLSGKMVRALEAGGRLFRPASGRRSRARRQRPTPMSPRRCAASRRRRSARRVARIGFSAARADTPVARALGRREGAAADGTCDLRGPATADPRRADQPSRHRQPRRTGRGDQRLRRRLHPDLARPPPAGGLRRPALAGRGGAGAQPTTAISTITRRLVLGGRRTRNRARQDRTRQDFGAGRAANPFAASGKSPPPNRRCSVFKTCWPESTRRWPRPPARGAASPQAIDLAAKRRELERALVAAEETWLELSVKAEAAN